MYKELKAYFLDLAVRRSTDELGGEFARLRFTPYAPVRVQLFSVLRAVNRLRAAAGRGQVPHTVLPLAKRPIRPFVGREVSPSVARSDVDKEREDDAGTAE